MIDLNFKARFQVGYEGLTLDSQDLFIILIDKFIFSSYSFSLDYGFYLQSYTCINEYVWVFSYRVWVRVVLPS